ncbi:MAG: GGDEF domain-containing protein, partial [Myxococcales bacterium]|nr:GGDEF domain-containing protein [Myxococcales bacterium]
IAKAIADQLALTKSNIGLRESLQFLATRDPLTGLFNRRHLDDSIDREFSRSKRNNSPVAAWMVDIDHFKAFNDTHGHPAADRVLAEFGRLLRTSCRDMDLACRFGGEEFVVILPDCTREDAARRAEAFREKVANTALEITVSVGVAEFPGDGHSWEMVLRRADDALYQAKRTGRNRVVLASREQEGA